MKRLLFVLIAALLPGAAYAETGTETRTEEADISDVLPGASAEVEAPAGTSPRDWVIELHFGQYRPNIDSEAGLTGEPYKEMFENRSMWLFGAQADYLLWQRFGTLSVGFAGGFANVSGHGIVVETQERAPDLTSLRTVPLRALATYRFDWLDREAGIPLIPYGKAGLAYTIWWVDGGRGMSRFAGDVANGGKWGYQLSGGLALNLNFFDRGLAREFDMDFGVNSVFLNGEYMVLTADNFGGEGFDLSDEAWMFGLGFEF